MRTPKADFLALLDQLERHRNAAAKHFHRLDYADRTARDTDPERSQSVRDALALADESEQLAADLYHLIEAWDTRLD